MNLSFTSLILFHLIFAQTQLSFRTISLWNEAYVEINQSNIPVSKTEDVFNQEFGSFNFVQIAAKNPEVKNPTVSLNLLEIGFDMINTSSYNYQIESITLDHIKSYELDQIDHKSGKWKGLPPINQYQSAIRMQLVSENQPVTNVPKEAIVYAEAAQIDNRINLSVSGSDALKGKLLSFEIVISLTAIGSEEQSEVRSNKTYFLAIK